MHTPLLTFVNHACFHVATEQTLLLVDPWVEGAVFNNGWSLLDGATSNAGLVRELGARKRNIYIWYFCNINKYWFTCFASRRYYQRNYSCSCL